MKKLKNNGFSHGFLIVFVVVLIIIVGIGLKIGSHAQVVQAQIVANIKPLPNQPEPRSQTSTSGNALRDHIQSIARSQLGVSESPSGSNYIPGNPYNSNSYPWCAYFASWVWQTARVTGINGKSFPTYGYTGDIVSWGLSNNRWHSRGNVYKPKVGDMVLFNGWVHTAMIDYTNGQTDPKIRLIAGNYGDKVAYQVGINGLYLDYQRNFSVQESNGSTYTIAGYVTPN